MSQHDMNIANQGFPAFRADLNDALLALVSNNSGASAPATTFANMPWYDTTNNIFKIRNEDNDAWISVFTLDQTTDAITAIGSVTLAYVVSLAGTQTLTNKTLTSPILTNPTVDKITTGVSGAIIGAGNSSLMKNRIINGAMMISQRGTSFTPSLYDYTLDRYQTQVTQSSKFTIAQSTTAPTGFGFSMLATSTSAYSITSTDCFAEKQYIEGFNFYDCAWGTASAKTVTLSFWVQSSLTGTFGGSLQNAAGNRSYPYSYTISSANTWTQVSVTIPGDTAGTWVGATNGVGCVVIFSLGMGSTLSGTAGAWASADYRSATGATSVVGTNGATFYITGVQLEVGSSATGFEYRQYGQELALCQRYYETFSSEGVAYGSFPGSVGYNDPGNNVSYNVIPFSVKKRASPTITSTAANTFYADAGGRVGSSIAFDRPNTSCFRVVLTVTSGFPAGYTTTILASNGTTVATLNASAEL